VLDGLQEMLSAMDAQVETVQDVTPELLVDAAAAVQGTTVALLSLLSHAPGTPTPSAPGEPPAMISGELAASIVPGEPFGDGGTFGIEIGPTAVYSRIQELGGLCGKNYRTSLPPRPYLGPAAELATDDIGDVFAEGWAAAF
jgi:hypothetical protein